MRILKILFIHFILVFLTAGNVFAEFGIDTPYEEAVPSFLETITQTTEDILNSDQLEDIADWNETNMARINEFLNDLLVISQNLEDNNNEVYVFAAYEEFVDKWGEVAESFPHFEELAPAMNEHINALFEGFPKIDNSPLPPGANPMAPLANHYNDVEAINPWGLGSFWNDDLILRETSVISQKEATREDVINGFEEDFVSDRQSTIYNNDELVYSSTVEDDEEVDQYTKYRPPTFVHEVLEGAEEDNLDPTIIDSLKTLVGYMDDGLEKANDDGVLDDCSYFYIQRGVEMVLASTCEDVNGNEQDFDDMLESDPFDWIKRPFLGFKDKWIE